MKKKLSTLGLCALLILAVLFAAPSIGNEQDFEPTHETLYYNDFTYESTAAGDSTEQSIKTTEALLDPDGSYTTKEDVAHYIHLYGCLPTNFITKSEARDLGWESGGLEDYAPGKCIGGDRFGNYEGLLPDAPGRTWTECDIDTLGKDSRGAKRIVFSNDGLIYYTGDHYESFELMYGEP